MEISFKGKTALVTGAAGGLGLATARMFAESGAQVVMADINEPLLRQVAQELKTAGLDVTPVRCDVADEMDVKALIEKTVAVYGRLDAAYNNVGVHAKVSAGIAENERSDFDRVIAINLGGIWNCMKYEILQMKKQGWGGSIVNASSQCGLDGLAGVSSYTASKHGVVGLTKCAALEYAREGIKINAICPGTCDTPMVAQACAKFPEHMEKVIDAIPLGRIGKPDEIASTVLWLCSSYSSFVIGQPIAVDGGCTIV